jgi:hypothetical protein
LPYSNLTYNQRASKAGSIIDNDDKNGHAAGIATQRIKVSTLSLLSAFCSSSSLITADRATRATADHGIDIIMLRKPSGVFFFYRAFTRRVYRANDAIQGYLAQ